MIPEKEITPQHIFGVKDKIQKESTTWLRGHQKSSGLLTECLFTKIKYTDKITKTAMLGQPQVMFKGDVGVGKTDLIQSMAMALEAICSRISFTPDMMPYDILGGQVLVENTKGERRVQFKPGPIFAHLVLADEANRGQPKTKSALLEAMEERSISPKSEYIDDDERVVGTLPLFPLSGNHNDIASPRFFMVMLTQNIFGEEEGTYPDPMAQRDRVTLTIPIERPSLEEEKQIRAANFVGKSIKKVSTLEEVLACADWIFKNIKNSPQSDDYLTRLLRNTVSDPKVTDSHSKLGQYLTEYIAKGASPRTNLHLEAVARTRAFFDGSMVVTPEHIKAVAGSVVVHRLILKPGKEFTTTPEEVFEEILQMTEMPKWK